MRVLGRAEEAQASMRAWRLDPLPEMSTTRLYCGSGMARMECGVGVRAEVRGGAPQGGPKFLEGRGVIDRGGGVAGARSRRVHCGERHMCLACLMEIGIGIMGKKARLLTVDAVLGVAPCSYAGDAAFHTSELF